MNPAEVDVAIDVVEPRNEPFVLSYDGGAYIPELGVTLWKKCNMYIYTIGITTAPLERVRELVFRDGKHVAKWEER